MAGTEVRAGVTTYPIEVLALVGVAADDFDDFSNRFQPDRVRSNL
jgi:hypothetical protein